MLSIDLFFAASGGCRWRARSKQVDLDQYSFGSVSTFGPGRESSPGPFRREAHEETSDRMKSALVAILILILVICGAVKVEEHREPRGKRGGRSRAEAA